VVLAELPILLKLPPVYTPQDLSSEVGLTAPDVTWFPDCTPSTSIALYPQDPPKRN